MEKFEDLLISMGKIGNSKKAPVSRKEIKKTPIPKTSAKIGRASCRERV